MGQALAALVRFHRLNWGDQYGRLKMTNFTQLHLSNKSQETDNSKRKQVAKELARQKVLFGSTLFAITAMSGVLLLITNGCSKGPSKVTSQNPGAPISTPSMTPPAPVVTTNVVRTDTKPVRKHVVQKKAPTATFSDPINGISFRYPKTYVLKTGNEASLDVAGMGPLQMNFVQPGGSNVAAVELPKNSYPGTDFGSAFFSVSVNPELSESECGQFAFPLTLNSENESTSASKALLSKTKVGGVEFSTVEDFGTDNMPLTDESEPNLKYYHRFENGNCYEFTMGVSITPQTGDEVKSVNRGQVFHKLEQILATVRGEPAVVPEVAKGTPHPMVEGSRQ
jgi:hypothetical protein